MYLQAELLEVQAGARRAYVSISFITRRGDEAKKAIWVPMDKSFFANSLSSWTKSKKSPPEPCFIAFKVVHALQDGIYVITLVATRAEETTDVMLRVKSGQVIAKNPDLALTKLSSKRK